MSLILLSFSFSEGVYAVQSNESTGPGGYGWQQVYEVPAIWTGIAVRITGSADRQYYDYNYKQIQISGRYENYWSRDCGWWYVQGSSPSVYITITDNSSDTLVTDYEVTTTRGRGTYTHTWGSDDDPGEWTIQVKNGTSGTIITAQFKIYVRGQLNVTSITITGNQAGSPVTIDAIIQDNAGNSVDTSTPNYPTVTMYISGSGFNNVSTMGWSGSSWQQNFTPPNPGDYYITVKASDGHNYWIDGRGSNKTAVTGVFPASFGGSGDSILKVILMILLALILLRQRRGFNFDIIRSSRTGDK